MSIPILILKEGTEQSKGRQAQVNNIHAARAVAETVQSSLGPRGMDKLLVDSMGDVVISNDGATILDEIDVQHPAGKMLVQVSKVQDDEVGDGTTTSVILAGELLKRALEMINKKIHPTVLVQGYKRASDKAAEILKTLGKEVKPTDIEKLNLLAMVSLNSKAVGTEKTLFGKIATEAVLAVLENGVVDLEDIAVIQKQGKSLKATELIKGVVLDKEVLSSRMPKRIENAKIALLDTAIENKKTEFDAKIRVDDISTMTAFKEEEENIIRGMVEKIIASGANVLLCQKGIDDNAQHYLAKNGILAARRIKKSDMERLSKATGAKIITNLNEFTAKDLGAAGLVKEDKIADDKLIYIMDCPKPRAVSIIIRGANKYFTDEGERSLHDALCVVRNAVEDGTYVVGAGATEIELARQLKVWAPTVGGREQIAVEEFANALEIIPKTLAENGGLDPIDILVALRSEHDKGNISVGINILTSKVEDCLEAGIIEPLRVKLQAIRSASESAELILRIDDVITARESPMPPPGAGGGMGGMPPGMGGMGGMPGMM